VPGFNDYLAPAPVYEGFFASLALHAVLSPDDTLGGQFAWLFSTSVQDVGSSVIKGGMHHLPLALARVLEAYAGEIRTNEG
jgi:phytoene dehydrogenase-like protein